MAAIIPKKSTVAGKAPVAADLEIGELAVNLADAKLYSKDGSGNIVTLGGGGSGGVSSFNTRTGAVTLAYADVTEALGFTPYDAANPSGYITISALSPYLLSSTASSTYQPLDADLTAIAGLAGTSGLLKKTAADTWTLDTSAYLTDNQTITFSGDATGSGTTAVTLTLATVPVAKGGTGATTAAAALTNLGAVAATNGTVSGLTLNDGYTEEVFAVSGTTPALSPTNGTIQTWTLTANSTPTVGTWNNGQSITLMIDDGTAYTINWASMGIVWKTGGGTAPTLLTTGYTVITLWEVNNTLYGARVGDA